MISIKVHDHGFKAAINEFSVKAPERIQKVFQGAVMNLFKRVLDRTPVDTGRLKAGWRIGTSVESSSELGPATTSSGRPRRVVSMYLSGRSGQKGRFGGIRGTRYVSAGRGIFDKSGRSTLRAGARAAGELSAGQTFYIYNNVRYAYYVEHGLGRGPSGGERTPRYMLALSMVEWPMIVAQARNSLM